MKIHSIGLSASWRMNFKLKICASVICTIALGFGLTAPNAIAQSVLIQNATVFTGTAAGRLSDTDVLIQDGRIAALGSNLIAPANVSWVDARGAELTPGFFGGVTALGIEEVQLEPSTVDSAFAPAAQQPAMEGQMRPEFLVTQAFNPNSVEIPVQRLDGITFAMVAPITIPGGSIISGQGELASLAVNGAPMEISRTLFIDLGGDTNAIAGGSRAAAWMLIDQAVGDARSASEEGEVLSKAGRQTLRAYLNGGRVAFLVDRASDIRAVLAWSKQNKVKPIIVGGVEAWVVAKELAAAQVPVLIDPLNNLPASFDQIGARLDNAALLHRAGVKIGFLQSDDGTANARKIRQHAGNAVAHGLPKDVAIAALTVNPASIFGVGASHGQIAVGQAADLVLWDGDPLELSTSAQSVWIGGALQPQHSRQTLLRDAHGKRLGFLKQ